MLYGPRRLGRCFVFLLKELEEFGRGSESLDCFQTNLAHHLIEEETNSRQSVVFEKVKEVGEDFVSIE